MFTSIFNDVLGPVMRGPSSSHTAGSYHIAKVIRDLVGDDPVKVKISFDRDGSYGRTYVQQGVDLAYATGLMGWKQTDPIFINALTEMEKNGVRVEFELTTIRHADHPNFVQVTVEGRGGETTSFEAKSVGGGTFFITQVNEFAVMMDGKVHELLLVVDTAAKAAIAEYVRTDVSGAILHQSSRVEDRCLMQISSTTRLDPDEFQTLTGVRSVRQAAPVYYVQAAQAPFASGNEMLAFANEHGCSLGEAVLKYETTVLGISEDEAIAEMLRRYDVMKQSVAEGLKDETVNMLLLEPMAGTIMTNVMARRVAIGGLHAKAAAAAMAAMHTCNSRGIVCAAPTGGAAGTVPGVLVAMDDEFEIEPRDMALMLFAAGGIGLILAIRATFAAEVAGCQVEIGAAGAMASAAVSEFAGGTARQTCDAGAIAFQNTMGLVCDLVQGMCELPCHTRNASAASNAFVNADMILAGYVNHIPLDETIDAVYAVGKLLPSELRCTARGGLAMAPSAKMLKKGCPQASCNECG